MKSKSKRMTMMLVVWRDGCVETFPMQRYYEMRDYKDLAKSMVYTKKVRRVPDR